jgi:parvulin-like peptidyl-prolyl isomerase
MNTSKAISGIVVTVVVSTASALAQNAAPAAAGSSDPVLHIRGLCPETKTPPAGGDGCTVAMSRQEFDTLMRIVAPDRQPTASMKQSVAQAYAELLAFDRAARESGIESSQEYRDKIRWLQLKTRAELFRHRLEKESGAVSDAEIRTHYRKNLSQFEQVKLRRLILPKSSFAAADRRKFEQEVERVAAGLRERAARGEDFERLQKEGYEALAFGGTPPSTEMGDRRRGDLGAEAVEEIFSLKPGEVSKVQQEKYSFVIYKVERKWTIPEEQVREEIRREIARQKVERALKAVTGNIRAELDDKYLVTDSAHQ